MANSYGTTVPASGTTSAAACVGLTNQSYGTVTEIDFGAAPPHECLIQLTVGHTENAVGANTQVVFYLQSAIDGTNFSDTGFSGARYLGAVKVPGQATYTSAAFPMSPLFGGSLPRKVRVTAFNDSGSSLDLAGGVFFQYRTETFA